MDGEDSEKKELPKIFLTIDQKDSAALRQAMCRIIDMVLAKIDEGQVDSIAVLMVSKDPAIPGGKAYTGSRMLVRPTHLDLIEDVYNQMMVELVKHYGVTPEQLRADRNRGKL